MKSPEENLETMPAQSPFHAQGKHPDVKLEIEDDDVLPRQRSMPVCKSEHFRPMSGSSFKEKCIAVNKPIISDEVDAEMLKKITHMVETERLHVDNSNIYDVLRSRDQLYFHRLEILSIDKFYGKGKYSDVKLRIGDEVFSCQRSMLASISDYFDTMFNGSFKEKNIDTKEPIVLGVVDAAAFREIVRMMYTGTVRVSDSNVYALLSASDFLQLRTHYVEDQCFEYLYQRSKSSELILNAFQILSFAHMTGRMCFFNLMKSHIFEHVTRFCMMNSLSLTYDETVARVNTFVEEFILKR